jgi:transcriptional regulator with XRE-family HTH domain
MEQFARNLHAVMRRQRITNSGLARLIWGSSRDTRGYDVAANRNRIGDYLAARSMPRPETLRQIAEALGTTPEALAPEAEAVAVNRTPPEVMLVQAPGRPDKAHLKVDKVVSMDVALRILALLAPPSA